MSVSTKIADLSIEVENLCMDVGFDFNESFDQSFAEIRRIFENLETLAEQWSKAQPDPFDDAYSDLSVRVNQSRKHGQALKAILSKEKRITQ